MKLTPEELCQRISAVCIEKLNENRHKDNPFDMTFERLARRQMEEGFERAEAFHVWKDCPTEKNLNEYLRECADEILFIMFPAAKAMGATFLERRARTRS